MSARRSGVAVVKKEEAKTPSVSSPLRRNSFSGTNRPTEAEADETKKAPKSVGGIDSLIASVSKISISKDDDKTIDAAAPKVVSAAESEKPTNKPAVLPKTLDEDDELSSKSPAAEDVTASYVSSMKEILSSFDRTLQFSDNTSEKKVLLTRSAPAAVKKEKDNSWPLPRFLITGASNDDGVRLPIKRRTMPAARGKTSDSVKSPSSITAAVDEKESKDEKDDKTEEKTIKPEPEAKDVPRPRRARSRTNPFEEGDIVRSSRAPLPRRRFVPQDTSPYNCNASGINMASNNFADVTIDDILASHRHSMSQLELYGFPDLASGNLNLGLDTNLAGEGGDIYNSFSASPTPELIDPTEVEPGLGVYSSPIQPLTPPSTTNIDFAQNALTSPYGSPQTGVYYATNNIPVSQSWSTQASTIRSQNGPILPVHPATPTGLNADAVMEMKRLILLPLSQDPTLLQFTPLIAAASMRLDEGRILCLRDLEKYLLYKSQEMSPSPQALVMFYEKFLYRCQTALGPIEAVGGDLTRPNDTPYYEGYFMDVLAHQKEALLSQMVSASTAAAPAPAITILQRPVAAAQGPHMPKPMAPHNGIRKMNTMHRPQSSINEKLQERLLAALEQQASMQELANLGGLFDLSGRDLPISPVSQAQELNGGSDDGSDDNGARTNPMGLGKRKKSIQKPQGGHVCLHRDDETGAICGKKYNRPCDLKKHGKTHSRPHKCSEPSCLYHEKGFPTEKERDRHETDRHSDAPQMWYCEFPPCPYKSKRESNCKQHMEKQHDYVYERSKHNPRNPNGNAVKSAQDMRKGSDASLKMGPKPVALFEHGISTPPQDVNAYMPTLDETNEMAKIQQMYLLTPSPDTPQTFRSGSVDSAADMQQQQQQQPATSPASMAATGTSTTPGSRFPPAALAGWEIRG
ncbi:hypothetical protein DRE_00973 [Drechslerella stenobrocha 248]|uniref:C2H2-type domain-containing protein n=1 Tax=Drechslerella stenobrocha 248 TaxID=1043628 RepID=W7HP32_9PEZI|nr:hypothetical protein DRE_00973 [Drechslerella stenobrocha 248]